LGAELVSSLIRQVDVGRLRADVARLASGERHSLYSPARHAEAVDYISAVFGEYGLAPTQHTFDLGGHRGINIVACKTGNSPSHPSYQTGFIDNRAFKRTGFDAQGKEGHRSLLVSAHYDTVPGSPGADDNASGVAALLECTWVLSTVQLRSTVEYVAFDIEEIQPESMALVGSTAFVKHVLSRAVGATGGKKAYEGLYNLEMVSYTSGPGTQGYPPGFRFILPRVYERVRQRDFLGDFIGIVARGPGIDLGRRFQDAASQWVPDLEVLTIEVRYRIPIPVDIFRSDHTPFWAAGMPAIMLTDTANFRNPHYHRSTDTPDTPDIFATVRTLLVRG